MTETRLKFYGARLREARMARGLKAVALTQIGGVKAASISQYENDKQTPPPHVIAEFATSLNVPPHFFTTPPEKQFAKCINWRSQAAASKGARERAETRYEWFRRATRMLESMVELPTPRLPEVPAISDPTTITQSYIEDIASRLRREWGLGNGPISNLVQLVENHGAIVVRNELGDECLDAFSDWDEDTGRCYIVLGTDKYSFVRSRLNLGHEIAHILLHRHVPKLLANQPAIHKEMEAQANRFSAALLLPSETFPSEVFSFSLDGLLHLKKRWGVAVAAMIMRLADLELIDEARKTSLFMQISKRKWRQREPLDDELVPEQPKLLRRTIDALVSEQVMIAEELTASTVVPISEIESLLGLEAGYLGEDQPAPPPPFQLRLTD